MTTTSQYEERRRETTRQNIAGCRSRQEISELLDNRKVLARIYREDGAHETARCIEEIDIAMIEALLR